ncbi:MAG: methyl-accepting chemotaxis protein [Rhizomicrobium sp.]
MLGFINQKLSIALRLALVGGIFTVFAGLSTYEKVSRSYEKVDFFNKEMRGVDYTRAVWDFVRTGKEDGLKDHAVWDKEFESASLYDKLIKAPKKPDRNKAIVPLLTAVSDASNIGLDPDSESGYIGQVYTKDLPSWLSSVDKLFKLMDQPASEKRDASLQAALDSYAVRKVRVKTNYANALKYDADGSTTAIIKPKLAALTTQTDAIEDGVEQELKGTDADIDGLRKAYEKAMTDLSVVTGAQFDTLVQQHIADAKISMRNTLLINLAFIIPSLLLITLITLGLSRRFKELDTAMTRLNHGDKAIDIPYLEDTNETGRIAQTLAKMKQDIIEREEATKQRRADRLAAEAAQREAELEAQRRSEELVVSTFGDGLKALAEENLSFRLTAEVPAAYRALKDNFNTAIGISEQNRRDREEAARQREADRVAAEIAQKKAEAETRRQAIEQVVNSFGQGLNALAERDLTYRITGVLPEEYLSLQRNFNNALDQLEVAMSDIAGRARDVSSNCSEISRASHDMAKRTEQQAAALEETSAAVTMVTQTVKKSEAGTRQANENAEKARKDADRSNQIVQNAVDAMHKIAKSSGEITQIISVIDEIAFQTNLLALNAGVEAARAGEAGRGFAVVAQEVRALAGRSAEAAKQIKALIQTSESQVDLGVKLVGESGAALNKIVDDISAIGKLMGELAAGQREQSTAMHEIDAAVAQMDQVTQQNAAMAEQSNASTEALEGYSRELSEVVTRFKTGSARSMANAA